MPINYSNRLMSLHVRLLICDEIYPARYPSIHHLFIHISILSPTRHLVFRTSIYPYIFFSLSIHPSAIPPYIHPSILHPSSYLYPPVNINHHPSILQQSVHSPSIDSSSFHLSFIHHLPTHPGSILHPSIINLPSIHRYPYLPI